MHFLVVGNLEAHTLYTLHACIIHVHALSYTFTHVHACRDKVNPDDFIGTCYLRMSEISVPGENGNLETIKIKLCRVLCVKARIP